MIDSRKIERTAADAFKDLIDARIAESPGLPYNITKLSDGESQLSNGIAYCYAEVTFADGAQYGTEAFGDEAKALHYAASSYMGIESGKEPMVLIA